MNERMPAGNSEHEQRAWLIMDILDRSDELLTRDERTMRMTYEDASEIRSPADASEENAGIMRRTTLRAVESMYVMLDPAEVGSISGSETQHRSLVIRDHETENIIVYSLTEVYTGMTGLSRMLTVSIGNSRVHRLRGVFVDAKGKSLTTNEIRMLDDGFYLAAYRSVDDKLASVLSPILQGKIRPDMDLAQSMNAIRQGIKPGVDADAFMTRLVDRFYDMSEANKLKYELGMDDSEMSVEQLQDLLKYVSGDTEAIGIFSE